jgi:hypothetical protein
MTVDELLALAARIPANVRRLEFDDPDRNTGGPLSIGRVVIETAPTLAPLPPAPEGKPAEQPRSDVDGAFAIPPTFVE